MVKILFSRRMENGGFQSCVAYVLLANGARDRSWKPFIECQVEQPLSIIKLLKQTRKRTCCIYRCSLLSEEVLGEDTQRACFGSLSSSS